MPEDIFVSPEALGIGRNDPAFLARFENRLDLEPRRAPALRPRAGLWTGLGLATAGGLALFALQPWLGEIETRLLALLSSTGMSVETALAAAGLLAVAAASAPRALRDLI